MPTSSAVSLKKFDFHWKKDAPPGVSKVIPDVAMANGTVLVATDKGVAYKASSDTAWTLVDTLKDGSKMGPVKCLGNGLDKAAPGIVATGGNGYVTRGKDRAWYAFTASNSGLPTNTVNVVRTTDPNNNSSEKKYQPYAMIGTSQGLVVTYANETPPAGASDFVVQTAATGLPSNNILDVGVEYSLVAVITDAGLAIGKFEFFAEPDLYKKISIAGLNDKNLIKVSIQSSPIDKQAGHPKTKVLIATDKELALSGDTGNTWKKLSLPQEFTAGSSFAIQCVLLYGNAIYAGTNNGLLVSNDKGLRWHRYAIEDGLASNNVLSISVDPIYDDIALATDNGICIGKLFTWTKSTVGLPANGIVTSIVSADIGEGATKRRIAYAGVWGEKEPGGVYKSEDDCKTWIRVYRLDNVNCLFFNPKTNWLLVGTNSMGLLEYRGAENGIAPDATPTHVYRKADGLINDSIQMIAGSVMNSFYVSVYLAHDGGISYRNLNDPNAPWGQLTPANGGVPNPHISSVRLVGDRLYCSSYQNPLQADGYVASFAVSEPLVEGQAVKIDVRYSNGNILSSVDDSGVVGQKTFISSHDNNGFGGDLRGDIRTSSDLSKWLLEYPQWFLGAGLMAADKSVVFIYGEEVLMCCRASTDEWSSVALGDMAGSDALVAQQPFVGGGNIYLPGVGCVLISPIDRLI